MKRTTTIGFAILYLLATSGILVGQHLCMGRVKDTALFKKVEKKCGMSMEMHQDMEGCCDDGWSLEKVDDDQQISAGSHIPLTAYYLLYEVPFQDLTAPLISSEDEVEIKNTGPPDSSEPELYILYHTLKIPLDLQS